MENIAIEQAENVNWKHIYVVSTQRRRLLVAGISGWLTLLGKYDNIFTMDSDDFNSNSKDIILPDSLVLFICLGEHENIVISEFVKLVKMDNNDIPVLVMDIHSSMRVAEVKEILMMKKCGVIRGDFTETEVLGYIDSLYHHDWLMCDRVKLMLLSSVPEQEKSIQLKLDQYSTTEQRIIEAAQRGLNIVETAEEIGLSPNTVAVYRSKLMKKAGIKSMAKLYRNIGV